MTPIEAWVWWLQFWFGPPRTRKGKVRLRVIQGGRK